MSLGFQEIAVLVLLALLLFGAKRLPDVGRSIGKSIREFKKAFQGEETDKERPPEEHAGR